MHSGRTLDVQVRKARTCLLRIIAELIARVDSFELIRAKLGIDPDYLELIDENLTMPLQS